jgi:hypothetical protein
LPRLSYFMGDLYPNLGSYNDTTAQTIPLPGDVAAMDQDNYNGIILNTPTNINSNHMQNHYFGLLIIVGTIIILGIRL